MHVSLILRLSNTFPLRLPESEIEPSLERGYITESFSDSPIACPSQTNAVDWTLVMWIHYTASFLPRHCLLRLTYHSAKKIQTFPLFSYPVTDFFLIPKSVIIHTTRQSIQSLFWKNTKSLKNASGCEILLSVLVNIKYLFLAEHLTKKGFLTCLFSWTCLAITVS